MSLYIIEDRYGALRDSSVNYNFVKSLQQSKYPYGHIVEMVPAKPKVKVSQEEADMLETAKHPTLRPSYMITEYSNSHKGNILGNDLEDRLMCAYVNGYTVAKEKTLYNVKVPHATLGWYAKRKDGSIGITGGPLGDVTKHRNPKAEFTDEEINRFNLQDCEKELIADD